MALAPDQFSFCYTFFSHRNNSGLAGLADLAVLGLWLLSQMCVFSFHMGSLLHWNNAGLAGLAGLAVLGLWLLSHFYSVFPQHLF